MKWSARTPPSWMVERSMSGSLVVGLEFRILKISLKRKREEIDMGTPSYIIWQGISKLCAKFHACKPHERWYYSLLLVLDRYSKINRLWFSQETKPENYILKVTGDNYSRHCLHIELLKFPHIKHKSLWPKTMCDFLAFSTTCSASYQLQWRTISNFL